MVFLDTRWKPAFSQPGYPSGFTGRQSGARHHWGPSDTIEFPPEALRKTYGALPADAWAAAVPLFDYTAFISFGPAGRIAAGAVSERARVWQNTLDLITRTFEANWSPEADGRFVADGGATEELHEALADAVARGDLYVGMDGVRPVMRAQTLSAWLMASLAEDLSAERHIGTCQTCGRLFTLYKTAAQHFCSTRCRQVAHRAKQGERVDG